MKSIESKVESQKEEGIKKLLLFTLIRKEEEKQYFLETTDERSQTRKREREIERK